MFHSPNVGSDTATELDVLYRRYGPMVLRRCRFLLRDEDLAVDAMHDVFVNVLRGTHRLRPEGSASLLHRIATNVCLNRLRTARRHPQDADEELLQRIAGMDDLEGRTLAESALSAVFGKLPESTRTLAVLHLVDGMTLEETAEEVGMSVSGVRKRLRALKAALVEQEEAA